MKNPEKSKRPTHRVYVVRQTGEKSFWTEIGAAWTNQDGKGFNLKLYLIPTAGTEIVVREATDEGDAS